MAAAATPISVRHQVAIENLASLASPGKPRKPRKPGQASLRSPRVRAGNAPLCWSLKSLASIFGSNETRRVEAHLASNTLR